jgi:hypothetical protein
MSTNDISASADWRTERDHVFVPTADETPTCSYEDCGRTKGLEPIEILGGTEPVTDWACVEHIEDVLEVKLH